MRQGEAPSSHNTGIACPLALVCGRVRMHAMRHAWPYLWVPRRVRSYQCIERHYQSWNVLSRGQRLDVGAQGIRLCCLCHAACCTLAVPPVARWLCLSADCLKPSREVVLGV